MTDYKDLNDYPRSKAGAAELGISRYFTGKKCIKGHLSLRATKTGMCLECVRETARTLYQTDEAYREKMKENFKRRYQKTKEQRKEITEAYRNKYKNDPEFREKTQEYVKKRAENMPAYEREARRIRSPKGEAK